MSLMRRALFAALLLSCGACGTSNLVTGNPTSSDASLADRSLDAAADADADLDASSVCPDGGHPVYDKPGCDGKVAPICVTFVDACTGIFCDCDGRSIVAGCGLSERPFASFGLCPGDTDAGTP